jgi:hypothetical protein
LPGEVRLVLHTAAYWLMLCSALACSTTSRIRLAFAAACPEADLFRRLPGAQLPLGPDNDAQARDELDAAYCFAPSAIRRASRPISRNCPVGERDLAAEIKPGRVRGRACYEWHSILAALDDQVRTNILIFDACRNNPLEQQVASAGPTAPSKPDRDWRRRLRWGPAPLLARAP